MNVCHLQVGMAGGTVVPLALKPKAGGAATSADWALDETELRNAFSSRTKVRQHGLCQHSLWA